jgi:hypothetical protein
MLSETVTLHIGSNLKSSRGNFSRGRTRLSRKRTFVANNSRRFVPKITLRAWYPNCLGRTGVFFMEDRIRDVIANPLTLEYFNQRTADGWVVQAVEWTKPGMRLEVPAEEDADVREPGREEVPYGQRVAKDCGHLVEDAHEMAVLVAIYEKVVSGWRPMQIAADLNDRGYRTRRETVWTPGTVFDLLPRLIELSPRLQRRPDWPSRRARLEISA